MKDGEENRWRWARRHESWVDGWRVGLFTLGSETMSQKICKWVCMHSHFSHGYLFLEWNKLIFFWEHGYTSCNRPWKCVKLFLSLSVPSWRTYSFVLHLILLFNLDSIKWKDKKLASLLFRRSLKHGNFRQEWARIALIELTVHSACERVVGTVIQHVLISLPTRCGGTCSMMVEAISGSGWKCKEGNIYRRGRWWQGTRRK